MDQTEIGTGWSTGLVLLTVHHGNAHSSLLQADPTRGTRRLAFLLGHPAYPGLLSIYGDEDETEGMSQQPCEGSRVSPVCLRNPSHGSWGWQIDVPNYIWLKITLSICLVPRACNNSRQHGRCQEACWVTEDGNLGCEMGDGCWLLVFLAGPSVLSSRVVRLDGEV